MLFRKRHESKGYRWLKEQRHPGGLFSFIRSKTERATRTDPKPITIYITEDMWEIIRRWRNPDQRPDSYLFPIMDSTLNPLARYDTVPLFTKFINDRIGIIAHRLGISKKITTIVSRHSFSTQLKRSGASTEYIQEALGHKDKKTTENYLDSFSKEQKKQYASMLSAFKKEATKSFEL